MSDALDAQIRLTVQGLTDIEKGETLANSFTKAITQLAGAMDNLSAMDRKQASALSQTIGVYQRASSLAGTYAAASLKAAAASKENADAAETLDRALAASQNAIQNMVALSAEEVKAKTATLSVYSQQIALSERSAAVALNEARAKLTLAEADRQVVETSRLSSGQGAPLSEYQAAQLAASKEAAARREATQAADQQAAAEAKVAAASEAAATASKEVAVSTEAAAAGVAASATSLNGSYFAMFQVAAVYGLVSKAAYSLVAAPISVAASFQQSFADVQRTVDFTGDNINGQIGALRASLVDLSTQIPVSFQDISKIATLGGQLNIAGADLTNFTNTVASFSALTNSSIDNTALAFGRLTNLLQIAPDQYRTLASTVLQLGTTSAATETEILNVSQNIAAVAHAAGFGTQDVLAYSTALASLKVAPELARGTMTRLLQNITKAADDGAKAMTDYAHYLGLTAQQALDLEKSNPASFFTQLIAGIHNATAAGQSMSSVLGDLGIKNTRDIDVVTRLANNYQLLAQSVTGAYSEFGKTDAIDKASQTIFGTLAANAQKFSGTFNKFLDSVGSSALAPLSGLLSILGKVVDFFNLLPHSITAPALALAGTFAVYAGYKAVLALSLAATLAFKNALGDTVATSGLNLSTLRTAISETFGSGAQVANAGAVEISLDLERIGQNAYLAEAGVLNLGRAFGAYGVEATIAAGANIRLEESLAALPLELSAVNLSAEAAAGGLAVEGAAAEAAGAATKGAFLGLGGIIGIGIGVATAAIAIFQSVLSDSSDEATKAAQHQKELNDSFISAAGGAEAIRDAVQKDTQAYKAAGDQANESNGVFEVYTRHLKDVGDGTAILTDQWTRLGQTEPIDPANITTIQNYAGGAATAAGATQGLSDSQESLRRNTGITNAELEQQTIALGKNVLALEQNAINAELFGKDLTGGLATIDIQGLLREHSINIADLLKSPNPADIKAKLDPLFTELNAQLAANLIAVQATGKSLLTEDQANKIKKTIADLTAFEEAFTSADGAVRGTATNAAAAAKVLDDLGLGADNAADGAAGLDTAAKVASGSLNDVAGSGKSAADVLSDLSGKFKTLVSDAFSLQDAQGGLAVAFQNLGASIAQNGTDFTTFTDAGRANLAALEQTVNAFADVQAQQIQAGTISAAQAAQNVQGFISNLFTELSNQHVDTSQLDFLASYAAKLSSTPVIMSIGADNSAAVKAINDTVSFAAQAQAYISGLGATYEQGQDVDKAASLAAKRSGGLNGYDVLGNIPTAGAPQATGGLYSGAGNTGALNDLLNYGKTQKAAELADQAAKQQASDSKKAGQAADDAGKQEQQAQKDTQAQIDKTNQFLKDTASYYGKLGSASLAGIKAEGDAFSSLNDLGDSIAKNGTRFNTVTAEGRANFDALSKALDGYGETLQQGINDGSITIGQAGAQFRQYAGGVRDELRSLGVPLADINGYFNALGATGTFGNATSQVKQFAGAIKDGFKATVASGQDSASALNKAAEAAKNLKDYLGAVSDYFGGLGKNLFQFVNAEGAVYESLQKLGSAVTTSGKSFNTLTDAGRSNFSALSDVISAYGDNLGTRVQAGIITAKQGQIEMAGFARGVYNELTKLGVKASEILPYFASLGIDTKGFATGDRAVAQYAGVLTNAAAAARAAAQGTSELSTAMQAAATYASTLSDNLNTAFDRLHGLQQAQDAVTTSIHGMSDAYQTNVDKIKDLITAQADLKQQSAAAQADYDKLNREYLLAAKYGQGGKAASLLAQRDAAGNKVTSTQSDLTKNATDLSDLQKYGQSLEGNSKYAIANRASLLDLQKTMFDQIDAYAKTGASTQDVTTYTKQLQQQFQDAGVAAGYNKDQVKKYTDNFNVYIGVVKSTPRTITTTVNANTDPATAALAALPSKANFLTTAYADTATATAQLRAIPTAAAYHVTASVAGASGVAYTLDHVIPKSGTYTTFATTNRASIVAAINSIPKSGNYTVVPSINPSGVRAGVGGALSGYSPSLGGVRTGSLTAGSANIGGSQWGRIAADAVNFGGISSGSLSTSGIYNSGDLRTAGTLYGQQVYVTSSGNKFLSGGGFPGFASGGLIPGTPPANPGADNVLARTETGRPLMVRSREFIQPQPSVDYYGVPFMQSIRNRTFPLQMARLALGGFPGGGGNGSGGKYAGAVVATLSNDDRRLLQSIAGRPVQVGLDTDRLTRTQTASNAAAQRAGRN